MGFAWISIRRRLHAFAFVSLATLCVLPVSDAEAQALDDNALVPAMIATVVTHDLGIPIGLLPFPITQLAGETAQYVANIGLKVYRPWLRPSKDGNFDNLAFLPDSDGDGDACSFHFYLPSATAEYENLFGIVPIRSPYYDEATNTTYLWQDRWGVLTPPRIYHANSKARLSVRGAEPVRRYDEAIDAFTGAYYPILDAYSPSLDMPRVLGLPQPNRVDHDGQLAVTGPQEVYLPVGYHTMEWSAATQLNAITDIIVPGLLLASAVHSEFKTAKGGLKVAKKVKQSGIGDDVVDQADNAADAATALGGKNKFDSIWEGFITRKEPGPIGKKFVKKLGEEIARKLLCPVLEKVLLYGVSVVDAETGAFLESQGQLTDLERKALDVIQRQAFEARLPRETDALKTFVCEDSTNAADFIKFVVGDLLRTFGLEPFVTSDTGVSVIYQTVRILDDVPPLWSASPAPVYLEATDFGGTRRYRAIAGLRAAAAERVSDNCGRVPELLDNTPEFLPLGQTIVTWTARDLGPNPSDDQDYAPTSTQIIIVEDTQPPLLLAPPSKVIEATAGVPLGEADIGDAVAIDLADVQPLIANDAPPGTVFPLDQRRVVQWTATDKSGNAAQASQRITVKTEGTNTQPVAYASSAATLTAERVDIRLTAEDFDILDGIADPLSFRIEAYPQKGEFIAPLLPFFIEDYRTKPGDGVGDDYDPTIDLDLFVYIDSTYCQSGLVAPKSFVHEARFVQVTDAGVRYVLDEFFECPPFNESVVTKRRFSKWNAAGDFLGQLRLGPNGEDWPLGDAFVLDRDGLLYYNTSLEPGSSSDTLGLWKCDPDFVDIDAASGCDEVAQFTSSSSAPVNASRFAYARVDSNGEVVYLADDRSIFAFELDDSGAAARYLGELGPKDGDTIIEDWFGTTPALEVGSDGSLYIADEEHHRIHKIAPTTIDVAGEPTIGDYVGWAGRCTGSSNKACDDTNERSRGYSCTFEPDSCTPTLAQRTTIAERALFFGAGQGQFNTPKYIAIDPNDVLYIADYENERVQRLSPDGSFAGEAVSDGSGVNKGDRPSFVLGNIGKPESVSVNSSQFYVVDRDEHFVFVFGTLPFKEITDNGATVTYVSDQDFPNPNDSDVDFFMFSVSDGLAVSDAALVQVAVSRNFRPPVALVGSFTTDEDTSLDAFELPADDPDGIAGKDFLGLDTLTYTVTAEPEHGTLTGSGAYRTYTPDADYYGEDRLRFKVNDGRDDSDEGTLLIRVQPVNDPPLLTIEVPERVALGFSTLVTSTFTDDPSESYEAAADWGDGELDETGGLVEDTNGDPHIEGVVVSAPPMPGTEGKTFAQHTYEELGPRTVEVCVTDSGMLPGCDSAEINVEELVSLGIGGRVFAEPLANDEITQQQLDDDTNFTYELTIVNALPSVGDGLTAVEVTLHADLPNLSFGAIESSRGTCERTGTALACALDNLEPGAEVTVTIAASGPGNLICNEDFDIEATLTTLSDALENEMEFLLSVELVADEIDGSCDGGTGVPDGGVPDGGGPGVIDPGETSSGCTCRVTGPSDYDTSFILLVLAFGVYRWRRRRTRATPCRLTSKPPWPNSSSESSKAPLSVR